MIKSKKVRFLQFNFLPMTFVNLSWMSWVNSDSAWVIAGIFALIGVLIALYNISKHTYHYSTPDQQLHIIRILIIVPLYSIISWISIRFHEESTYFEVFRDIYEAFVIYCFLTLILGYVGGEANCLSLISLKPPLAHPFPLCCLPKMQLNVRFLRFCKQSVLQFVILKPVMATINIIMLLTSNYNNKGYQVCDCLSLTHKISQYPNNRYLQQWCTIFHIHLHCMV